MSIASLANFLWGLSQVPGAIAFHLSTYDPEKAQQAVLKRILQKNSRTAFGKAHGFADIDTVAAFQEKVNLSTYEDYLPYIQLISQGEPDILFPGKPLRLEPTSGSTSASKLIPYSEATRAEFQAGIAPWILDLWRHCPQAMMGQAYWSISPVTVVDRTTEGGIPIGFEDDTDYLAPWMKNLVKKVLPVPLEVSRLTSIEDFRYVTLAFLLSARDLSLISVWNPTFLTLLLEPLEEWAPSLINDLRQGHLSTPNPLPQELHDRLVRQLGAHPQRAQELSEVFAKGSDSLYGRIWPKLALISCWTDAAAEAPSDRLKHLFPKVRIASKGLLATEGFVSIPLLDRGSALSLNSHFFEFIPEEGPPLPAWKLREGECYEVVITTGGGLYRYRLGDMVQVMGFYHKCPILRFLGRSKVSDLYGEKLNETHVARCIQQLFSESPPFAMLAPEGNPPDRYVLYYGGEPSVDEGALSSQLEKSLCENMHYAYCRTLGQLKSAETRWIGDAEEALRLYHEACCRRGQKAGDIKPSFLSREAIWASVFI